MIWFDLILQTLKLNLFNSFLLSRTHQLYDRTEEVSLLRESLLASTTAKGDLHELCTEHSRYVRDRVVGMQKIFNSMLFFFFFFSLFLSFLLTFYLSFFLSFFISLFNSFFSSYLDFSFLSFFISFFLYFSPHFPLTFH